MPPKTDQRIHNALAWSPSRVRLLAVWVLTSSLLAGCVSWNVNSARNLAKIASFGSTPPVTVRKRPNNPLASSLNLVGRGGPKPSERTEQVLRRYDLLNEYQTNPEQAVKKLFDFENKNHSLEIAYAWTELAYIRGEAARRSGKMDVAMHWYTSAAAEAFHFLFHEQHRAERNAYDPNFRQVCDLYNQSLEGMLRILDENEMLIPNQVYDVSTESRNLKFTIRVNGRWKNHDFSEIKFVSDLNVEGLTNHYRTFGLGVPLVAVRNSGDQQRPDETFYPPDLAMPMTAFFQVPHHLNETETQDQTCVLELFDPLEQTLVSVNGQTVPLESDISTPLAYYLKDPLINTNVFATLALIDGDFAKQFRGLYMLEPFDPNKIPVVMVHGLWSSPITWTEMYNDLRADRELRERYQFWFYLYPSGQPFWVSASQMRADLAQAKRNLDPHGHSVSTNEMILVGHSMGGLVSRLQTLNSNNDFWATVSDKPFSEVQGEPENIQSLNSAFFFSANPSVKRVITLGTPHQGSRFANSATRWFSNQIFRLPSALQQTGNKLVQANPEVFQDTKVLRIRTSVDSLAPTSPFFQAMANAERAPWVRYHNVIGQAEITSIPGLISQKLSGEGDGVVSVKSARSPDTVSEITVPAEHTDIHQHPRSILEVRRILLEHLAELDSGHRQQLEQRSIISDSNQHRQDNSHPVQAAHFEQ